MMHDEAALLLQGVEKTFDETPIIRGVALEVLRCERHAIIGPNGAGKSTLFHLISGRYAPTCGEIRLFGERIDGLPPYVINRKGLSRSFQVTNLFDRMSVFENLRCALLYSKGHRYAFWRSLGRDKNLNEAAEYWLERLNLQRRRAVPAGLLSYAEQRSLEIGMTVAGGSEVILLDEPTAGMSHTETEEAVHLIREVTQGRTLLIVEHDMGVVFGLADRISVLVYGEVIATDRPEAIRSNTRVQEAYLGTEVV